MRGGGVLRKPESSPVTLLHPGPRGQQVPSLQVGKCQADAAYRSVRLGGPRPSRLGGAAAGRGEQAAPGAGGWRKSSEGPRPDHGPLGFVTRLCLLHRPPPREDRQWQARGERLQVPPEASQPLGHGSEGQDPQCSEPWAPSGARALQTEAQGPARCAPHRRRAVGSPQLGAPASTPGSWCSADKGGVGGSSASGPPGGCTGEPPAGLRALNWPPCLLPPLQPCLCPAQAQGLSPDTAPSPKG